MHHQAQKGLRGIFVGIPQHQKGYPVYVTSTRKITYSYYDTSQPYSEAMVMRSAVTYTPFDTSSREQTGDIITCAQFEEGNILTKTRNDAESGDESNDK